MAGPWSQPHVIEDAPGQGEKPAGGELMGVRLSSIFCCNSERFMEIKRFALMIFKMKQSSCPTSLSKSFLY